MMTEGRLAAQLYTIRAFTQTAEDFAASMARIREIGYGAVQVSAIGPISDEVVRSVVTELGLTICITHTPYERLWNDLNGVIAQHRLWGCQHVGLGSMPPAFREGGEAGFRLFAQEAAEVGRRLHEAGLTFSYHNHSFEFVRFGGRSGLALIFEETDPRYLHALLDTYWIQHGGGDPIAWIRAMKGRAPVVHLKDMVIIDGEQAMAEVGEGNMNWRGILAAGEEAGVRWFAVEQDVCRRDPFESLAMSYRYLKGLGLE
jgi:sugar phosphate isomerase/epimerase